MKESEVRRDGERIVKGQKSGRLRCVNERRSKESKVEGFRRRARQQEREKRRGVGAREKVIKEGVVKRRGKKRGMVAVRKDTSGPLCVPATGLLRPHPPVCLSNT